MQHVILFDTDLRSELTPFTLTRPVSELRIGILTIREKWNLIFGQAAFSHITSEWLEPAYPIRIEDHNTLINGAVLPSEGLYKLITNLGENEALMHSGELIAAQLPRTQFERLMNENDLDDLEGYELDASDVTLLERPWHIVQQLSAQIEFDFQLLETNQLEGQHYEAEGSHPVWIHPDAKLEQVTLNARDGSIYIGAEALLMDGCHLRGPVSVGEKSVIKMGATLYEGTSIGPHCKVGGEVKNSLLWGYSNKAHEGYLGDSIIGAWCNLGALTTNSNLKNTFGRIKVWSQARHQYESTELMKCGIFVGDYSRTAIRTTLTAGTIVGVSCNLFDQSTYRGYIPSFTWGSSQEYRIEEAMVAAQRIQSLKGKILESHESQILQALFQNTTSERQNFTG